MVFTRTDEKQHQCVVHNLGETRNTLLDRNTCTHLHTLACAQGMGVSCARLNAGPRNVVKRAKAGRCLVPRCTAYFGCTCTQARTFPNVTWSDVLRRNSPSRWLSQREPRSLLDPSDCADCAACALPCEWLRELPTQCWINDNVHANRRYDCPSWIANRILG